MQNKRVIVGLIGFGHVGKGVFQILEDNSEQIQQRIGKSIHVKTIVVRDISKHQQMAIGETKLSTDIADILNDNEIDVVIEVMGGETPAYEYITQALEQKKYVVTANKEVVAKHKKHFFELAKKNNVDIYFEASVGGGIPIIRSFKVGYSANQIQSIYGILNGTTNYILIKIKEDNINFKEALKEAQALGFAEADPTMDISGLDAAYKLVILAAVAFKVDIQLDNITYEGIENITLTDMKYATELGYTIKLIATGRWTEEEKMCFKVMPTLVSNTHPLASVRNEFNAIFSIGNAVGESMIYGKGAGSFPTGSAVVSDLLDIAFDVPEEKALGRRNLESNLQTIEISPLSETVSKFYLRLNVIDKPGTLQELTKELAAQDINVSKVIQKECENGVAEIVFLTHKVKQKQIAAVQDALKQHNEVNEVSACLHVGLAEFHPKGILGI